MAVFLLKSKYRKPRSLKEGVQNLERHLQTVKTYNLPVVVALNRFYTDSQAEIEFMEALAKEYGVVLKYQKSLIKVQKVA